MEELFVGNSIILLFWVYISFIIEVEEKSKKVMLMYLITYITKCIEYCSDNPIIWDTVISSILRNGILGR